MAVTPLPFIMSGRVLKRLFLFEVIISCFRLFVIKSGVRENSTDFPQEEVLFDNSKHSVILGYALCCLFYSGRASSLFFDNSHY